MAGCRDSNPVPRSMQTEPCKQRPMQTACKYEHPHAAHSTPMQPTTAPMQAPSTPMQTPTPHLKVVLLRQLLNRVPPVPQDPLVAVDVRYAGDHGRGVGVAAGRGGVGRRWGGWQWVRGWFAEGLLQESLICLTLVCCSVRQAADRRYTPVLFTTYVSKTHTHTHKQASQCGSPGVVGAQPHAVAACGDLLERRRRDRAALGDLNLQGGVHGRARGGWWLLASRRDDARETLLSIKQQQQQQHFAAVWCRHTRAQPSRSLPAAPSMQRCHSRCTSCRSCYLPQ